IPGIEQQGASILSVLGLSDVTLPSVTIDSALTSPAVLAAVTFLPRSLASLALHVFRKTANGPEKISGGLETLIHEAPNAEWTSFKL
ncbi:phage portal protein, partial [Streptococcus pneumoniae]|uniref:phage portal protein n=1 Tax=Streptococcus pneumoniae TaxID=1313 RepID=UPI001CBE85DC